MSLSPVASPSPSTVATAAIVALAGLAVYWLAVDLFPYHSGNDDEGVYLLQAAMLLEGQVFLYPGDLAPAVRPWFFVVQEAPSAPGGVRMYAKYSPVAPAVFALGKLLFGSYDAALALVAAGNAALVAALAREAFDRATAAVAAAALVGSPLFLLSSSVFLSYAPTTLFNLLFAVGYVRAVRTGRLRYAALAGGAIGVAFFARPYTAVLFALPFVAHALVVLGAAGRTGRDRLQAVLPRYLVVAVLGTAGVAVALGYNALTTGDPLLFPYEAFAPRDGIGFGEREILGYRREYTPALAAETTVRVASLLSTEWTVAGPIGTALAVVGLAASAAEWSRSGRSLRPTAAGTSDRPAGVSDRATGSSDRATGASNRAAGMSDREVRAVVAGLVPSVVLGNAYFWGTLNGLNNRLIHLLGPFYHFDLLVPLSLFAGAGAVACWRLVRRAATARLDPPAARVALLAVLLIAVSVVGAAGADVLADSVAENRERTEALAGTYEPFETADFEDAGSGASTDSDGDGGSRPPADSDGDGDQRPVADSDGGDSSGSPADSDGALVFTPTPYGPWQQHPFQYLRNDPGFDGPALYALDRGPAGNFEVLDAAGDRTPYRFTYRGEWRAAAEPVEPSLRRLAVLRGDRIDAETTVGTPAGATGATVRIETEAGYARYEIGDVGDAVTVRWRATPEGVRATDQDRAAGAGLTGDGEGVSLPAGASEVGLLVIFGTESGATITYRQDLAVEAAGDGVRALWPPETRICRLQTDCGREGTYVGPDGDYLPGVSVETDARTHNGTATG